MKEKLVEMINSADIKFNKKGPYQSFPSIGLDGQRDTTERIEKYNIKKYIDGKDVVSIGSSLGFFEIEISKFCKSLISIESEPKAVEIQEFAVSELNIQDKIEVRNEPFVEGYKLGGRKKCDVIISAAAHRWIGMPFDKLIQSYINMLRKKDSSMILIESHKFTPNSQNDMLGLTEYNELQTILEVNNMKLIEEGTVLDECDKPKGTRIRQFSWWQLNV